MTASTRSPSPARPRWAARSAKPTAGSGKSLTLELGGKSPFIVFDDADIDGAVEGVVDAIWFNQGQVCCAGSRLLVQEGIAARLHRTPQAPHADPARGPCRSTRRSTSAPDRTGRSSNASSSLVATGVREGAELLSAAEIALPAGGSFYPPTLLTGVHPASTVATEEIFGPVLVTMTFRTPDEAVVLANNTRYGLAASVWSETIGLALRYRAAAAGRRGVGQRHQSVRRGASGFGGYRESGYGREGGREGCYEYLKPRAWAERKPRSATAVAASCERGRQGAGRREASGHRPHGQAVHRRQAGAPRWRATRTPCSPPTASGSARWATGNRKDIRNAVAAARAAAGWSSATPHNRAQIALLPGRKPLGARRRIRRAPHEP